MTQHEHTVYLQIGITRNCSYLEICIPLSSSELFHNGISLLLRHISVHWRNSEVTFPHLVSQPVDLTQNIQLDLLYHYLKLNGTQLSVSLECCILQSILQSIIQSILQSIDDNHEVATKTPTFLLVLQKMTACVMVRVSYRSHNVSNFHSSRSTATKNCLIPSNVNSSL